MTMKASKTNQYFQAAQLVLGATGSDLCRMAALLDFFSSRGDAPVPPFMLSDGSPLHRLLFVQKGQRALSASGLIGLNFNSHSIHIGVSTSTRAAGAPESTIKVFGRWKSMAYQQYIRPSMDDLTVVLGPARPLAHQCVPQA